MEDVTQEILLRLPVKSVLRCKLLSKHWQDFISHNRYFLFTYLSRNPNARSVLFGFFFSKGVSLRQEEPVRFLPAFCDGRRKRKSILGKRKWQYDSIDESLSFLDNPKVYLLGSSNGFLLATLECMQPVNYVICNPINKQRILLPEPKHRATHITHGFISNGTHHTVVRAIQLVRPEVRSTTLTMEIFTSESPHQWKQLSINCNFSFRMEWSYLSTPVITEKGIIIFPVQVHDRNPRKAKGIIIFDQTKNQHCIQLLEFPIRPLRSAVRHHCLGRSDGLVLYAYYELGVLRIWELCESKADDSTTKWTWSLKRRLTPNITLENYPEFSQALLNGEILFYLVAFHPINPQSLFISVDSKNFLLKLEDNPKLELICDFEDEQGSTDRYSFFPYSYGFDFR